MEIKLTRSDFELIVLAIVHKIMKLRELISEGGDLGGTHDYRRELAEYQGLLDKLLASMP